MKNASSCNVFLNFFLESLKKRESFRSFVSFSFFFTASSKTSKKKKKKKGGEKLRKIRGENKMHKSVSCTHNKRRPQAATPKKKNSLQSLPVK